MGGVVLVTDCIHWGCSKEIEEDKLFCEGHWAEFDKKRQAAIFEAWMYGDLDEIREEDDDSLGY